MAMIGENKKKIKTAKAKPVRATSKSVKSTKTKAARSWSFGGKKKSKFTSEGVETVVEVKTVGDIPPVLQARKQIGEERMGTAATTLFNAARDDYVRYFNANGSSKSGNREFFITELKGFKVDVPEMGLVDNSTILDSLAKIEPDGDTMSNRISSLRKLAAFFLNYYERARYSNDPQFDGDELISKFSEIYNYMDIMKLYFSRNAEV